MITQGKRVDLVDGKLALQMGEYGKDANGVWFARPPTTGIGMGNLSAHDVTEHKDGTITVSPSILCEGQPGHTWHGYLEHGVWREV